MMFDIGRASSDSGGGRIGKCNYIAAVCKTYIFEVRMDQLGTRVVSIFANGLRAGILQSWIAW